MLSLGAKVNYKGHVCEVVGKKLSDFGNGPVVYELVLPAQKRTYVTRLKELKEVNDQVIAHIRDERLRGLNLKEASDIDKKAILNAPVVGFINIPEEDLEILS